MPSVTCGGYCPFCLLGSLGFWEYILYKNMVKWMYCSMVYELLKEDITLCKRRGMNKLITMGKMFIVVHVLINLPQILDTSNNVVRQ